MHKEVAMMSGTEETRIRRLLNLKIDGKSRPFCQAVFLVRKATNSKTTFNPHFKDGDFTPASGDGKLLDGTQFE